MVKFEADLDRTFQALADPTRRAIVDQLTRGERSVSDLARPFEMTLPAVHKHLGVLEEAGLIACRKEGRVRRCALDVRALEAATGWIDERRALWARRLDRLDRFLSDRREETNDQDEP